MPAVDTRALPSTRRSAWGVFLVFLKLGLTSFGGPIAHLGYFRVEFVQRRRWLEEAAYADLVALCQFLPGPASSQVGIGIGIGQAGLRGGLAAWAGFTLPSALLLIAFGYGISWLGEPGQAGWLHGLKIAAVAVVAQAVWGMAVTLCPDRTRITLAISIALVLLTWQSAVAQLAAIAAGGLIGWRLLRGEVPGGGAGDTGVRVSSRLARWAWIAFFALLAILPIAARLSDNHALALVDSFYRTGSLVFGGGHVVLPLLRAAVVPPGWISDSDFLAGYGAAQAVPGPLFTFAAYLGTAMRPAPSGILGGLLCLAAIFLPAFLLVVAALPYWETLRHRPGARAVLSGVNAAVVGILLAALYDPIWVAAIHARGDFALALAAFGLLMFWKTPPIAVVALAAAGGELLARL
jgi:chromate transporter